MGIAQYRVRTQTWTVFQPVSSNEATPHRTIPYLSTPHCIPPYPISVPRMAYHARVPTALYAIPVQGLS
eukprot:2593560-Rhodomonas_salina.6